MRVLHRINELPWAKSSLPVRDHVDHRLAFVGRGVHQKALSIRGRAVGKDIALDNVASRPAANGRFRLRWSATDLGPQRSELFYLDGKALIAVEIDGDGAALQAGALGGSRCAAEPRAIAAYGNEGTYAVAPDGKRFLVNQLGEEPTVQTPITVITNSRATLRWHRELTRLAPRRKGLQQ